MAASWHKWIHKLRAASAAAALLACWVSASAALAAQSADVCSMSCCVQEGHCCCTPHHAFVEGQGPDGRDSIGQAGLYSTCPSGCTTSHSITRFSDEDSGQPASLSIRLTGSAAGRDIDAIPMPTAGRDLVWDPRGPPASSLV
jgi:hypothetical protein